MAEKNTQENSDGFMGVLHHKSGIKWLTFSDDGDISGNAMVYVKECNDGKHYIAVAGISFTLAEWDIIIKHFPGSQK